MKTIQIIQNYTIKNYNMPNEDKDRDEGSISFASPMGAEKRPFQVVSPNKQKK